MRKHLRNYFIPHPENDHKPHSVRPQSLVIIILFASLVAGLAFISSKEFSKNSFLADVQIALLTQLTNENRTDNKIGTLNINPQLQEAARLKAQDMIDNQYFAHRSPQGKEPWHWMNQAGYKYKFAGENLAIDFYDTKEVAKAWMNSPTHRKNILNSKYTEIGMAVDTGRYQGRKVAFVVQMFGSPRYVAPAAAVKPVNIPTISSEKIILANVVAETLPQVLGEQVEATSEKENFTIDQEKETQELYTETVFDIDSPQDPIVENGDIDLVIESNDVQDYSIFVKLLAQPSTLVTIIVKFLIALTSLSLLLKVFIEFKKQHYKNVIFTLITLAVLIALYVIMKSSFAQVLIL